MQSKRKLPEGVIRLEKLEPQDIKSNDVTCINITVLPEKDGRLEFEGSWKGLIKAVLWLVYTANSKRFMSMLYEVKLLDRDFQIYNEETGISKNEHIVYTEKISGTPYYLDYDYSEKTMCIKLRQLLAVMKFKPKDILLTLKPR